MKTRTTKLVALLVAVALLLAACQKPVSVQPFSEEDFKIITTDDFVVYFAAIDREAAEDVLAILVDNHDRIMTNLRPDNPIARVFKIYPTQEDFHYAVGNSRLGLVAMTSQGPQGREILMASPQNPGPTQDYESMLVTAVQMFTYTVVDALLEGKSAAPLWLHQGVARYEAGRFVHPDTLSLHVTLGELPRFLELTEPNSDVVNFSYTIVEYVVNTWGTEAVRALLLNQGNVQEALNVSDDEFYEGWHDFLSEKYLSEQDVEIISSENFTVHFTPVDREAAQDVLTALEASRGRVLSNLRPENTGPMTVRIYPDLVQFHRAINMPVAPDWVVGRTRSGNGFSMVSPNNPGPSHSYDGMIQVAVHEFVHAVTFRLVGNMDRPPWLWEGIACYEAGQLRDPKRLHFMQGGSYPRFMESQDVEVIYGLGYVVVEYIVETWGMETVRELLLQQGDIQHVLNLTDDEFYEGWYEFVKQKYLD